MFSCIEKTRRWRGAPPRTFGSAPLLPLPPAGQWGEFLDVPNLPFRTQHASPPIMSTATKCRSKKKFKDPLWMPRLVRIWANYELRMQSRRLLYCELRMQSPTGAITIALLWVRCSAMLRCGHLCEGDFLPQCRIHWTELCNNTSLAGTSVLRQSISDSIVQKGQQRLAH